MKRTLLVIFLIICLSVSNHCFSQITVKQKNNEIKLGGGIGTGKQFTGITAMAAYNRYFGKNFASAQYHHFEEFVIFGSSTDKANEIALLVNRELLSNFVKISVGAGVSRVQHVLDNYPNKITLNQFGFPMELNITLGKYWFKTGISVHYNINSYNPYCNFNWVYQFRLF